MIRIAGSVSIADQINRSGHKLSELFTIRVKLPRPTDLDSGRIRAFSLSLQKDFGH
jgi:hypothetical protein